MTTTTLNPTCTRTRRLTRASTVIAATGATYTVWTFTHQMAGVDLKLNTGATVTPTAVLATTVLAGLAAWVSLALCERFIRRPATWWTWTAAAFLLVSLTGPLSYATSSVAISLTAMHLAAGAVLIPLMSRSSTNCRRPA